MATVGEQAWWALTGSGAGGGLAKLTITTDSPWEALQSVEAAFNPAQITRTKSVEWRDQPTAAPSPDGAPARVQFVDSSRRSIDIDLFFDTYENHDRESGDVRQRIAALANPWKVSEATDVRAKTDPIVKLAAVDVELHRPPVCRLSWGSFRGIFGGVLTSVTERFTMFLPNGLPVRAVLTCTFTAVPDFVFGRKYELHSSDVAKTWVVRQGDSLHSIAFQQYRDPRLWRHIAEANGIADPRRLTPGAVLTIPKLS